MKRLLTSRLMYAVIIMFALSAFAGNAFASKNLTIALNPSDGSGGNLTAPGVISPPSDTWSTGNTAVVTITAVPTAHWHFVNWTGTGASQVANVNLANTTISMAGGHRSITANFAIDQVAVTASAGANGSISPSGSVNVNYGSTQLFTATPNSGYAVNTWSVDSTVVQTGGNTYTLNNVTATHTVSVTFKRVYTLTTSTGANGTVTTPGIGGFVYDAGATANLLATPNANYHFVNWTGTGVTAGKVANPNSASTTITMDGNYTVQANFAIDQKSLTTSSSANGTVTTPGIGTYNYDYGTAASIVATPNTNYHFVNWTGSGVTAGKVANPNSASTTITMHGDYTVTANFAIDQKTLTTSSSANGTVTTPGIGTFNYDYGTAANLTATPNAHYHFVNWTGSGVTAGKVANPNSAGTTITMDSSYSAAANFTIDQFNITASAGSNGSINPSGTITKDYGSSQLFTAAPSTGYEVDKWSLDGSEVQSGGNTYTLSNISAEHSVSVTFKILTYQITASAGTNGSIEPSGNTTKDYGSNQLFTATPSLGYEVDKWYVDSSVAQTGGATYTLTNIMASHTVSVTFKILTYTISGNTGVGGVILGGLSVTSDTGGNYSVTVDYGWSGTVTPSKAGYTFSPAENIYSNIAENHTAENYIAIPIEYTLTISKVGNGSVSTSPEQVTYHYGDVVTLTATADAGWTFGAFSGDSTTGSITIDGNKSVTATFTQNEYTLTINKVGNGTVSASPEQATYHYGDVIALTATADAGWTFGAWSGDTTTGSITIDGNKSVTATFTQNEYTLTINKVGNGTVAASPEQATYHYGDVVTLTATADAGWTFGAFSGDSTTGSITIDGNKSVTATFTQNEYTLTINKVGNGTVAPSPEQATYHYGDVVTLTATADAGWTFGAFSGDSTTGSITIDGNKSVTATFTQNEYTLTISKVGNGTVAASPEQATYHYGDVVTLTATADAGWTFGAWTGDSTTGSITIDANKSVTATFTQNEYTLTINKVGNGTIAASPEQATYHYGDVVTLTATADAGWTFGAFSGDSTTGSITIDGNKSVTATFTQNEYTLTVNKVGNGTISASPEQATYHYGDVIALTATADAGWAFGAWSGDTTTGSITIDGNKSVTATFTQNEYTLTINKVGNGSIAASPEQATYHYGDNVTLTATADAGWTFGAWSGDTTTGSITIDANKSVTATFTQNEYTLTINKVGNGTVAASPEQATYHYGDVVTLTATADAGWTFGTWTGDTTTGSITIDSNKSVTATFIQNDYTLTISKVGNGLVSASPEQATYHYGDVVTLTATADSGWTFGAWSGDTTTGSITIDGNKAVTATFTIMTYTVTVSAGTNGTIDPVGDVTKDYGSSQLFAATPEAGYEVEKWMVDGLETQTGGTTFTLDNITSGHTVSVTFKLSVSIISGYIIEPDGNTPVIGAIVDANNNGGSIGVTDSNGYYELTVPPGWSGTVTVTKEGFTFEPPQMSYDNLTGTAEKDYAATPVTFIISGHVLGAGNLPMADVNVTAENGGGPFTSKYGLISNDGGPCLGRFGSGSVKTDATGYYEVMVDYNWTGNITVEKYAFAFAPGSNLYSNTAANQTGQDYTGTLMTFSISGTIQNRCSLSLAGVTVSANNGGGTAITDASGHYEIWVSYNWSGTVSVAKTLYGFTQPMLFTIMS